ncbi:MAG TPA: TOBE domain-containing protein, partial [Chloroflexi bacterium]|nr:TOBE domain-containing protein [Chloroflexota bacterium]
VFEGGAWRVRTPLGVLPYPGEAQPPAGRVRLLLRPDGFRRTPKGAATFEIAGRITEVSFRGARQRLILDTGGLPIQAEFGSQERLPSAGESIHLYFAPSQVLHILEG